MKLAGTLLRVRPEDFAGTPVRPLTGGVWPLTSSPAELEGARILFPPSRQGLSGLDVDAEPFQDLWGVGLRRATAAPDPIPDGAVVWTGRRLRAATQSRHTPAADNDRNGGCLYGRWGAHSEERAIPRGRELTSSGVTGTGPVVKTRHFPDPRAGLACCRFAFIREADSARPSREARPPIAASYIALVAAHSAPAGAHIAERPASRFRSDYPIPPRDAMAWRAWEEWVLRLCVHGQGRGSGGALDRPGTTSVLAGKRKGSGVSAGAASEACWRKSRGRPVSSQAAECVFRPAVTSPSRRPASTGFDCRGDRSGSAGVRIPAGRGRREAPGSATQLPGSRVMWEACESAG